MITALPIPTLRSHTRAIRLDAAQGVTEVRSELYVLILRASTEGYDAAMRQEHWQGDRLCSAAGQCVGGAR